MSVAKKFSIRALSSQRATPLRLWVTPQFFDSCRNPSLVYWLPLAIAGWLRYLLAVDDELNPIEVTSDPMKEELQSKLTGIEVGKPETYHGQLDEILSNKAIFGSDLVEIGLAKKIETMFIEELAGAGAVCATLHKYLG